MNCPYCREPVLDNEPKGRFQNGDTIHPECLVRMLAGSVGHQLRACSCYGGTEDDPKDKTLREGARMAAKLFCYGGEEGHA